MFKYRAWNKTHWKASPRIIDIMNDSNAGKSYKTGKRVSDGGSEDKIKNNIKPFEEGIHDHTYQVSLRS